MKISIISLFPDMFRALTDFGITSRAVQQKLINLSFFNPRDYTADKHRRVDDRPYGGGAGMVMAIEPLEKALMAAKEQCPNAQVILLTPHGPVFNQQMATSISQKSELIFIAGRYEGIDQRFIELYVDQTISLGDFVLSGGELAIMTVLDAIIRQLPGVLGNHESLQDESFSKSQLSYPQYTRPECYHGKPVPAVLLSGDHQKITQWRQQESKKMTQKHRPDLAKDLSEP